MSGYLDSGGGGAIDTGTETDDTPTTTDGDSGVISVDGPTETGETRTVDVQTDDQTTRHWVTTTSSGDETVTQSGEVTSPAATESPDIDVSTDADTTPNNTPAEPDTPADVDAGIGGLGVLAVGGAVALAAIGALVGGD